MLWIVATGLLARRAAQQVVDQLHQVESLVAGGHIAEADQAAAHLPADARRAHSLTTGPAWWLASEVPYFGRPLVIVRGTTKAVATVGAHSVPDLLQVAASIDPATLRTSGKTLDLAPLIANAPKLGTAATSIETAIHQVSGLPNSSWLSEVDHPRQQLASELTSIGGYVSAASRAADVLPAMLGDDGPKRYFIGLQNEAEMRGTGGLPGAFAIVVADHGTITFTHFESDDVLLPAASHQMIATGLNFGSEYQALYGHSDPTTYIVNSNLSPNFPYAAQIWAAMWQKVSGEHVDGAIALDPNVLADFLAVTGPVALADHAVVSADNVVSLTERDEYAIFNNNEERKDFLVSILKAVSTKLTTSPANSTALAQAMSSASKQQRLLVWSSDAAVEAKLEQTTYAGAIPQTQSTLVGMTVNNIAAGKLDYYLVRSISYNREGCGSTRDVLVTITLSNNAPASGLPAYVVTRGDKPGYPTQPGDNRTLLDYYATPGSQLLSVSQNGIPTTAGVLTDLGHPVYRMDLELPRGKTQTIVLHLTEPRTTGPATVWQQPGVTPLAVKYFAQSCS